MNIRAKRVNTQTETSWRSGRKRQQNGWYVYSVVSYPLIHVPEHPPLVPPLPLPSVCLCLSLSLSQVPTHDPSHLEMHKLVTAAGVSLSFRDTAVCMVSWCTWVSFRLHFPAEEIQWNTPQSCTCRHNRFRRNTTQE